MRKCTLGKKIDEKKSYKSYVEVRSSYGKVDEIAMSVPKKIYAKVKKKNWEY